MYNMPTLLQIFKYGLFLLLVYLSYYGCLLYDIIW